ncbi:TaqI-like C-terminal specificity domain-containing protein [Sphingobacterium sp. BN32]|uniref:Eco57I restriction-modification methylase domain-containing protein n=1 Tax=Sphingobacterium sp. BN32 TaxID=3058432 RepID=UPI00265D202E|nr:TaqI-like C-terminal specificity domain-containing protein [Sphingobacterium sp. BN32]WKK59680.1 TaqI-like C-terminal specificity domain-containing protein [Sphingobacterium sp. BN32]
MDRATLHKLFEKAYNHQNWIEVLQSVFGARQLYAQPKPILLPNNERATEAFELGSFTTSDDRIIGLYRINVKSDVWLERNKVSLRELLRNVYNYDVDGAIVVFVQDEKWRLSFISEIKVLNDEGEIIKQATEPKRYTYLLGKDEKVRTPSDRLSKLTGKTISLQDMLNAFSVEALNEEFYKIVQSFFYELVGGKIGKGKKITEYGNGILQLPHTDRNVRQEFAVRLIGRTVFCWFLKMKKSDDEIALLPENLLSSDAVKHYNNYYHTILERLFFQTLNTPMGERLSNLPEGADTIPFLNGGLFEPNIEDYYKPDSQGNNQNHFGISNDWFLRFFGELEKYNFTIDENSVTEIEVSVDPEMLGRIFENLLAEIDPNSGETARKATGSFYTPREIVDYMATESLVQYLHNQTGIEQEKLRSIFKMLETADPEFTETEKDNILDALDKIKILDPACGSGAFPMGVLQKIVQALQKLDPEAIWWINRQVNYNTHPSARQAVRSKLSDSPEYARKFGIIQKSLYGVDIQPIAAEISKLRCFLSLVVDENIDEDKPNRGIEALPNLEFKFVTADTLMRLPETQGQSELNKRGKKSSAELEHELNELRQEYIQSFGEDKKILKQKFQDTQKQLFDQQGLFGEIENNRYHKISNWNPFNNDKSDWFDPKWMFGVEKFDVIIGNPPYIQLSKAENITKEYKDYLKNEYKTSGGRLNTFIFFIHKGLSLLNSEAILTYIIPNTILTQDYYSYTREHILKKHTLKQVVNYVNMPFANAVVENVTLLIENSNEAKSYDIVSFEDDLKDRRIVAKKNSLDFLQNKNYSFNFNSNDIIEIIENSHLQKIDDYCLVNQAIALKGDKSLSLKDSNPEGNYYKLLDGRNIKKYRIDWDGVYLDYDLDRIHSCKTKDIFESDEKLMFRRVSSKLIFTYDNQQYFALNTIVVLNAKSKETNLKYLLGILNSKLANYYYNLRYKSTKKVFSEIQARSVKQIPIPLSDFATQSLIQKIVEYLLFLNSLEKEDLGHSLKISYFEQVIDGIVYELYFPELLQQHQRTIVEHAGELPSLTHLKEESEKMNVVETVFNRLNDKTHPVRNNLFFMKNIKEIALIEGINQ